MVALSSISEREKPPFVSVIVPVFNSPQQIATCIEALLRQTYPGSRYEILIVDNGSTDNTPQVVQRYPVKLLLEDRIQGSYAARNRGIRSAQGDIIALTDADCEPIPQWLEFGVRALLTMPADLVGGRITFVPSPQRTAAELFDAISNMQIESNVRNRGLAKTANLFVRREVIEELGLFDPDLRSGGDVLWTGNAARHGFTLVYSAEAAAAHPTRKLRPLLRKQIRVGRGQIAIWRKQGLPPARVALRMLKGILPPSPWSVRRNLRRRGVRSWFTSLAVWLNGWSCKLATSLGRIRALTEPTGERG